MRKYHNPFKALGNLFTGGPKTERTIIQRPSAGEEAGADKRAAEEAARKQRAALAQKKGAASTLLSPQNGGAQGQRKTLLGSSS